MKTFARQTVVWLADSIAFDYCGITNSKCLDGTYTNAASFGNRAFYKIYKSSFHAKMRMCMGVRLNKHSNLDESNVLYFLPLKWVSCFNVFTDGMPQIKPFVYDKTPRTPYTEKILNFIFNFYGFLWINIMKTSINSIISRTKLTK